MKFLQASGSLLIGQGPNSALARALVAQLGQIHLVVGWSAHTSLKVSLEVCSFLPLESQKEHGLLGGLKEHRV